MQGLSNLPQAVENSGMSLSPEISSEDLGQVISQTLEEFNDRINRFIQDESGFLSSEHTVRDRIQGDILSFVLDTIQVGGSNLGLQDYHIQSFETIEGNIDIQSLNDYREILNDGINNIIELGGLGDLQRITTRIQDIEARSFSDARDRLTGGQTISETFFSSVTDQSPEMQRELLNRRFNEDGFGEGLRFALLQEAPAMIEDLILLVGDLAHLPRTLPRYIYCNIRNGHEFTMEKEALASSHPIIGLIDTIVEPEKRQQAIQALRGLLNPSSWTAGTIATILSTVGTLGTAGAIRGASRISSSVSRGDTRVRNFLADESGAVSLPGSQRGIVSRPRNQSTLPDNFNAREFIGNLRGNRINNIEGYRVGDISAVRDSILRQRLEQIPDGWLQLGGTGEIYIKQGNNFFKLRHNDVGTRANRVGLLDSLQSAGVPYINVATHRLPSNGLERLNFIYPS
ncbi:hypothetical protein LAT59_01470 [Candidatus Gracilibacteria bacterium]|nr:hypothetical protein [Candidatus Gracilibacteria bacterium]